MTSIRIIPEYKPGFTYPVWVVNQCVEMDGAQINRIVAEQARDIRNIPDGVRAELKIAMLERRLAEVQSRCLVLEAAVMRCLTSLNSLKNEGI